jgi:shikimate dehydrogenase
MSRERYAVLGDPISHSLSPAMHAAAFRAAGIDAAYEAIRVPLSCIGTELARLQTQGYRGLNITVPLKAAVLRHLDEVDTIVPEAGAANTVFFRGKCIKGFNTDVQGFLDSIRPHAAELKGQSAIVFGAGGAARGVIAALRRLSMGVTVLNRSAPRAQELARYHPDVTPLDPCSPLLAREAIGSAHLLVNATSLGLRGLADPSPLPAGARMSRDSIVYDLVYGRPTAFLAQAAAAGCRALDGLEMLVMQGAGSFLIWTGTEPDIEVMRAACARQLEGVIW